MDVSIVVPTKNAGPAFRDCLERVYWQVTGHNFEVIVIDSGSSDTTIFIACDFPVRLLQIPASEFNHGETRNLGAEIALGKYIVFLTQDALPADEKWLENLVRPLEEDSLVAGSYSRQVPYPNADLFTRDQLDRSGITGTARKVKFIDESDYVLMNPAEKLELARFDNVSSCVRKSVWREIRFPEAQFAEDLIWGKKVLESGYKIVFEPRSAVIHSHSRSIKHDYERSRLSSQVYHNVFGVEGVQKTEDLIADFRVSLDHRVQLVLSNEKRDKTRMGAVIHAVMLTAAESLGRWQGSRE